MKLSVIIVSYNVSRYLEQCLLSVLEATKTISAEIIVVDNHSNDNSCSMVMQKFPQVKLICNKKNVGFSAANNQAIRESSGEYVLLLNPDTVVGEHTIIETCIFMDKNADAGAVGVKMINGKGKFLPESKRGLPSVWASFCKIIGFNKLFPKSRIFGKYHLLYLNNNEIHPVDVLSGAYFLTRKKILDNIGLLDEDFFMYGEDIDLSYRITKAGFKNYYFPAKIIHYKGESTKKESYHYVRVFHESMRIFYDKHFKKQAVLKTWLIKGAVYFCEGMEYLSRFVKKRIPIKKNKPAKNNILVLGELDNTLKGILKKDVDSKKTISFNPEEKITLADIHQQVSIHQSDTIIFTKDVFSFEEIIDLIESLNDKPLSCHIYLKNTDFIL